MIQKLLCLAVATCCLSPVWAAQTPLEKALPLLQKKNRSAEENLRVLQFFRSAADANSVFASGAALVKTPPPHNQQSVLWTQVLRSSNPLKQTFSAIILTSMGAGQNELRPLLDQARKGQDPMLRTYSAAAYALLEPNDTTCAEDIVRLYALDPAFAQRAMNALAADSKQVLRHLKKAAASQDTLSRAAAAAWLGDLHTQPASQELLKMAKRERDSSVSTQLATALAKNRDFTLSPVVDKLSQNYQTPQATTYALALGFMTGYAAEPLRRGLSDKNLNTRINSARAAAYMAGVLANPDAFHHSQDRAFDIYLLKGLIAPLQAQANSGHEAEQMYAQNALRQIEKLME